jgi:hypothetical protein
MRAARLIRRWRPVLATVLAAAMVAGVVALGPGALRRIDAFTIDRVEVSGTRFTEPYAVVRAAGIHHGSNLFDDADAWRAGVLELPMVTGVVVRRRLPSTLAIEVREAEPVALVAQEELRPVDAAGRALALDPAGVILDLPILTGVALDGDLLPATAMAALAVLLLMREREGPLAERVSQVEVLPGAIRVVLRDGEPDALLPLDATPLHLTQLRVAYTDLAGRGELGRAGRIDVRFRDQVVVSFLRKPVS